MLFDIILITLYWKARNLFRYKLVRIPPRVGGENK